MLEISEVWDEITDANKAALLEVIAGKVRANAAAAILSNGDLLKDAYETSTQAAGAADKAMAETMTSIESRIALFNQATQTMWSNTISSDLIKSIVDIGTEIVKLTDKAGLLSVALAGVFGFFGAKGQGKHTNQRVSLNMPNTVATRYDTDLLKINDDVNCVWSAKPPWDFVRTKATT